MLLKRGNKETNCGSLPLVHLYNDGNLRYNLIYIKSHRNF